MRGFLGEGEGFKSAVQGFVDRGGLNVSAPVGWLFSDENIAELARIARSRTAQANWVERACVPRDPILLRGWTNDWGDTSEGRALYAPRRSGWASWRLLTTAHHVWREPVIPEERLLAGHIREHGSKAGARMPFHAGSGHVVQDPFDAGSQSGL
jgi:hypothetical protein